MIGRSDVGYHRPLVSSIQMGACAGLMYIVNLIASLHIPPSIKGVLQCGAQSGAAVMNVQASKGKAGKLQMDDQKVLPSPERSRQKNTYLNPGSCDINFHDVRELILANAANDDGDSWHVGHPLSKSHTILDGAPGPNSLAVLVQ